VAAAALSAGCASSSSDARPTTPARLQIVEPTPNQVTGPDVTVTVEVVGGKLVTATTGELTADEGHVHLTLDGRSYVMSYRGTRTFADVAPGPHSLQAEFVAKDHAPFVNRPRAFVRFNVRP
jgi:hypothetical protein